MLANPVESNATRLRNFPPEGGLAPSGGQTHSEFRKRRAFRAVALRAAPGDASRFANSVLLDSHHLNRRERTKDKPTRREASREHAPRSGERVRR